MVNQLVTQLCDLSLKVKLFCAIKLPYFAGSFSNNAMWQHSFLQS